MQTDGRTPLPGPESRLAPPREEDRLELDREAFEHLIPFHLMWNGAGQLLRASNPLKKLWRCPPDTLPEVVLERPFRTSLEPWIFPEVSRMVITLSSPGAEDRPLRGEILPLGENRWLFSGAPSIGRVSDLETAGLMLSDLPLHTGLGDALIANEAAQNSLRLSEAERLRLETANRILSALQEGMDTKNMDGSGESYFRAIIENSSDIMLIVDQWASIRYVSPSANRILGPSSRSLTGKSLRDLLDPKEASEVLASIEESILSGGTRNPVQFRLSAEDGRWKHFEAVGRLLGGGSQPAQVVMSARDVSERKGLEERLRRAHRMESIGRLAGGVAHDFNNILTVIQGHTALLQMSNELSSDGLESAQEIVVAAERATALTRQLLTFSRKQVVRARNLDIPQLVGNLSSMLARILGEDIRLEVEIAPDLPMIHADEGMLEQVLMTLTANSRDAMPTGGRLVINASRVVVSGADVRGYHDAREGTFIRLSVADTGVGISAENLDRIFEPFFSTKEFGQSTGLGLAAVHGILKLHGGWIDVDSEPGRGTVFRTFWPVAATRSGPKTRHGKDADTVATPSPEEAKGGLILVVEDEAPLRELVQDILLRQGYEVVTAHSGAEALRRWPEHRERVRLLLTDIVMPEGVNGWDLADRLLADRPNLRVIYTSGYSPEMVDRQRHLTEGDIFLQKPYNPAHLLESIQAALRDRGPNSGGTAGGSGLPLPNVVSGPN